MSISKTTDLCRALVRLQLASQQQIDDGLMQFGRSDPQVAEFVQLLEQRGVLSSYQASKLQKGETDGLVLGRYKLLYRNASGSFARVYRGCGVQDGKMVGIKVLRQRWAKDPQVVREFRREAELGRGLKHDNIVPIYEIGQDGDLHYFTMEFIEGGNLRDFINIRKKLSPREAAKCVLEMTQGLHYAASRGAMHRDLKMTNVLMSSQGVAMLVDFGLSGGPTDNLRGGGESFQRALDYATLERGTGAPLDDPRSDLYFLGTIFYELLTGSPPLERTRDRQERKQFSRYQLVPPLRSLEPALPDCVAAVVDKLMQLNPAMRYQNTGEVLRDLRAALTELDGAKPANGQPAGGHARPPATPALPTIMCIENRVKQQDMLREYFSKHGFRVLVLGDLQRGLNRLRSTPPDGIVVMAESAGESACDGFREVQALERSSPHVSILVLGENQAALKQDVAETPRSRILIQPVTLRDLRKTLKRLLRSETEEVDPTEPGGSPA